MSTYASGTALAISRYTSRLAARVLAVKPRLIIHIAEKRYHLPSLYDPHGRGAKRFWSLTDLYWIRLVIWILDSQPDGRSDMKDILASAKAQGFPNGSRPIRLGNIHYHAWRDKNRGDCFCQDRYALDITTRINPRWIRHDVDEGIRLLAKRRGNAPETLRRGGRRRITRMR